MLFWYMFILSIFEEAGPYRARRGAGTSIFGAYFSKNRHSPHLQHSSGLGNSTPWSASSRRCDHTNSHQNPASVALFREKMYFFVILYFFYFLKGWDVSRSPRGRNLNFRSDFFEKSQYFQQQVIIFQKSQYFHQKVIRDKPESIGNGLTSSGPVYLYRVRPGWAP